MLRYQINHCSVDCIFDRRPWRWCIIPRLCRNFNDSRFSYYYCISATAYPLLEVQRSATRIEKEMHMFITRMGILSLGEVGAKSIFDILKQMSDYGELASEVKRIETLVDKWIHIST